MATVAIQPKTAEGHLRITITTLAKTKAKLVIETWKTPPLPDKLLKRDEHTIIAAKASADKKTFRGKIDLIWPLKDPELTVSLNDGARSVRVQVTGHGALDQTHKLTAADYAAITGFVATAFP